MYEGSFTPYPCGYVQEDVSSGGGGAQCKVSCGNGSDLC